MRREGVLEDDLRKPPERLVVIAHPPFFLDDFDLGFRVLRCGEVDQGEATLRVVLAAGFSEAEAVAEEA